MENNVDCVFHLFEENVQDFLEANLGRRLTPMEINRMKLTVYENGDAQQAVAILMYCAGEDAIDNTNERWDHVDKDFLAGNHVFGNLSCKEK
jgi:hypothetical protein